MGPQYCDHVKETRDTAETQSSKKELHLSKDGEITSNSIHGTKETQAKYYYKNTLSYTISRFSKILNINLFVKLY